jgi:hypothetical protein
MYKTIKLKQKFLWDSKERTFEMERHIEYHTDNVLDIFDPIDRDDSITRLEWLAIPDSGGVLTTGTGIPQAGQKAQFILQDPGIKTLLGRSYVSVLWQPWSTVASAPIVDGSVAYTNTFPLWESMTLNYGNSEMESCSAYLHQKTLVKNLLKYSGDESYKGAWLSRAWAPDTGSSPTHGGLTNGAAYTTGGYGVVNPMTITNGTITSGAITFTDVTTAGANPMNLLLGTVAASAGPLNLHATTTPVTADVISIAAANPTQATSVAIANPTYNQGFFLRNQHVTRAMNQPAGSAWANVSGGYGAVQTMMPLWDLCDTLSDYDKFFTGGSIGLSLNVSNSVTSIIQVASGVTLPATPHTIKILSLNLMIPTIEVDPLVEARIWQRMLEKQISEAMYKKNYVFQQTYTVSSPQMILNWFISNFNQNVTEVVIGFKYSTFFAGTQDNNSMVFQGIPATNVTNAYIQYGNRTWPDPAMQPGISTGQIGQVQAITTLNVLQNRLTDREGSSCIDWSQFANSGIYSFLPFDMRNKKIDPMSANSNSSLTFNCTMNTIPWVGANHIPALPDLPTTDATGVPTAQLQVWAFVTTEGKMTSRFGNRTMSISSS